MNASRNVELYDQSLKGMRIEDSTVQIVSMNEGAAILEGSGQGRGS